MTTRLRVLLFAAAFCLPACFDAEPDLGKMHFACRFDSDCLDGYKCREHDEGKYCTPFTEVILPSGDASDTPDVTAPADTSPADDAAAAE